MTTDWLLTRIAEAVETNQLWMLDTLALNRAWEAQG